MIRLLQQSKEADKKQLREALDSQRESEEKMDLYRLALERYVQNLPPQSPERGVVRETIEETSPSHYRRTTQSAPESPSTSTPRPQRLPYGRMNRNLAVTGKLEVR